MPEPAKTASITVNILWKGQLMPSEQFLMRLATPTNQYLTLYCDQTTPKLALQGMCWLNNGNWLCQNLVWLHQFPFIYYKKDNWCPWSCFWCNWPPQQTNIWPATVTRPPRNERVKPCVVSITATDYARTRSDCINFHSYIIRRPTDALGIVFDAVRNPNRPIVDPLLWPDHPKMSASRHVLGP